uniref:UDENN domain-containing protein n=1 Tax=Glossina morsitans morsitans TaxID=37546 RepID=A0A1B0G5M5_GLOMM
MGSVENKPPILHIVVIGFHHKFGCQVEFSFPPLVSGSDGKNQCPSGWKYLSTLALPDGSHNFVEDTVFFNLPSLSEPTESIYGVSCYRQIPVERLKLRTADMTRSTVQKSVCCLARQPIYGYIEVKLSLIADAFFQQGDFSNTELLQRAYQQLNACLMDDEIHRPQRHFYLGLSLRAIVLHWRHKMLQLFKLLLLQRRVIYFGSPVRNMCALILGMASLVPRLLEKGFQEVACVRTSRPISPMPDYTETIKHFGEIEKIRSSVYMDAVDKCADDTQNYTQSIRLDGGCEISSVTHSQCNNDQNSSTQYQKCSSLSDSKDSNILETKRCDRSNSLTREGSVDTLSTTLSVLASINPDEYRAPISIFASGNLCLPYLSLPYMDLLTDRSVLSYVVGTSNVLFQQKRHLSDVLVDIENGNFDTHDAELRRQLILSTEDLRFMDYLLRHVQSPKEDAEGSEYWIREQFQGYVLALLRTAVISDGSTKDFDHFNANFMHALKKTQCFQEWYDVRPEIDFFEALPTGHPFAGTLSVADMKLKIAQTMQNSESGRKINQAVNSTSRAVGGAISQAKGAFSNWWSSITIPSTQLTSSSVISGNCGDSTGKQNPSGDIKLPEEISVAFQNKSTEEITVGNNMHVDGKPVEYSQNFQENSETITVATQAVDSNTQPEGVVEIGKEAEILNKNEETSDSFSTDNFALPPDNTNNSVFTV